RSIEYVLLDRALAGDIPAPPPEVLAKYFDERKIMFRTPEYRKLVVVSLIPSEQARWIEISDADLKRAYEDHRARYVTPERRHIRDFRRLQQDRGCARRRQAAGRSRRQPQAGSTHSRSRSLRPRPGRHAREATRRAASSRRGVHHGHRGRA